MATKLFLRNTQTNGIGATYYDMVTTAGASADTAVVNTAASGTEIQWTKTAGGAVAQWISGRVPAGGFTLTTTDISIWAQESNMNANAGGRFRVFRRTAAGVETEIGGGPFDDAVEFGTAAAEMTWAGNVTDQAFSEDDRILLKVYITNVGTMASGHTCTLTFNAADAATGDSFFNIAETVTFKAELVHKSLVADAGSFALTGTAATPKVARKVVADAGSFALTGTAATLRKNYPLIAGTGSFSLTGTAASALHGWKLAAEVGSYALTGANATLRRNLPLIASAGAYTLTGTDATLVKTSALSLAADAGAFTLTGTAATLRQSRIVLAGGGAYVLTGSAANLVVAAGGAANDGWLIHARRCGRR